MKTSTTDLKKITFFFKKKFNNVISVYDFSFSLLPFYDIVRTYTDTLNENKNEFYYEVRWFGLNINNC